MKHSLLPLGLLTLALLGGCETITTGGSPECLVDSYTRDESVNPMGPSRCSSDCDCDGARSCSSSNFCQGEARSCVGEDYLWDESLNTRPYGCDDENDCECDGGRTCSFAGFCEGRARAECIRPSWEWDEGTNSLGPNNCAYNCECDGARTCSQLGVCEGRAR